MPLLGRMRFAKVGLMPTMVGEGSGRLGGDAVALRPPFASPLLPLLVGSCLLHAAAVWWAPALMTLGQPDVFPFIPVELSPAPAPVPPPVPPPAAHRPPPEKAPAPVQPPAPTPRPAARVDRDRRLLTPPLIRPSAPATPEVSNVAPAPREEAPPVPGPASPTPPVPANPAPPVSTNPAPPVPGPSLASPSLANPVPPPPASAPETSTSPSTAAGPPNAEASRAGWETGATSAGRPSPGRAADGAGPGGAGVASLPPAPGGGSGVTQMARPRGGYQVRPPYPPAARRLRIEGTTLLRVLVLEDGRVGEVVVGKSAGHPDLDGAATDAVRRWRFEPARRGVEAVSMWVQIPVEFRLTE